MKKLQQLRSLYWLGLVLILMASCHKKNEDSNVTPASTDWNYENTNAWGTIAGNTECTGKSESPINIVTSNVVKGNNHFNIAYNYVPTTFSIINNGHTVQVNLTEDNSIRINGSKVTVQQFHFHIRSEHEIDGDSADMEMHIVHKDSVGTISVLAILLKKGVNDTDNPFLTALWKVLPIHKISEPVASSDIINLTNALPSDKNSFYKYDGSLTTPPCSQGVNWIVYKNPVTISSAQIAAFQKAFTNNHRAVQPLNYREVIEYDAVP